MPGIFGIINKKTGNHIEERQIDVMLNECCHENFYNKAVYKNRNKGIYLGGITLNQSYSDCLPIYNHKKSIILLIDGEVFLNSNSFNNSLFFSEDSAVKSASILSNLYEEDPDLFFKSLKGWYCGVVLDLERSIVQIFNDHFSIRRIYYAETEDAHYFASEAKAILKLLPQARQFDYKSLSEYFTYDCVLDNRTLFQGISLIPPNNKWTFFHDGRIKKEEVICVKDLECQEKINGPQFIELISSKLEEILPQYFVGEKLSISLTGGLDTRTILAVMSTIFKPGALQNYTFNSMYKTSLDTRISRMISNIVKQPHNTIYLDKEFLKNFREHAEKTVFITDGVTDICRSDEIYLNQKARKYSTIRITGKFGSQVIRNLSVLQDRPLDKNVFDNEFYNHIKNVKINSLEKYRGSNFLSFMLFKEIPWYWAGFTVAESSQLTVRSPYLDIDFIKLLYQCPKNLQGKLDRILQGRIINKYNVPLYKITSDKGVQLSGNNLMHFITKMIYQTQNYSDKIYNHEKLPFNSHHLVHFIDSNFQFLKMENFVAGLHSFRHYRRWFRSELRDCVQEFMFDRKTLSRNYLDGKHVQQSVIDHIQGRKNNTAIIKKIMTLELVNRMLLEKYK